MNTGHSAATSTPIATSPVTGRTRASLRPRNRAGSPPSRLGVTCEAASPYRFRRNACLNDTRPPAVPGGGWSGHAPTTRGGGGGAGGGGGPRGGGGGGGGR